MNVNKYLSNFNKLLLCIDNYSKRHDKFMVPAFAEAIYRSFCKAENKISGVASQSFFYLCNAQLPIQILDLTGFYKLKND